MGEGQRSNRALIPQAREALNTFKYDVARDLGVNIPQSDYWGDLPSRVNGAVGGHMVKRMIEMAERTLAQSNRF